MHLGHFCRRKVDNGAVRISQPADLQSSDILDSQAEGRGCIAVEADQTLASRRKRRLASDESAVRRHIWELIVNVNVLVM